MKTIIAIALLAFAVNASAATAFLQSCHSGTSVTGHLIYLGTYVYNGQYFQRNFDSYCPFTVEVY